MNIQHLRRLFAAAGMLIACSSATSLMAAQDAEKALIKAQKTYRMCAGCHLNATPGIVKQHLDSAHANPRLESERVYCQDCHGVDHTTMEDAAKAAMPTLETCGKCHSTHMTQHRDGKHNLAWMTMKSRIDWHGLPGSITQEDYRGCAGCHRIGEKGMMGANDGNLEAILSHDGGKEASQYRHGNAQCDTCHTRHTFSTAEARDQRICANCHKGFDQPYWEIYTASAHGIIWAIEGHGEDARAPTCQSCHLREGSHEVSTAWGFLGLRIPLRENVLALIASHPELEKPLNRLATKLPEGRYMDLDDDPQWTLDRIRILQAAGILDAELQPTERYLAIVVQSKAARGPEEFNQLREAAKANCNGCHVKGFVDRQLRAADAIIKAADHEFARAIEAVQGLYRDSILSAPDGGEAALDLLQFHEDSSGIERKLYRIMLKYRQRTFQGAFHASAAYMHWYGWAPLKSTVAAILEEAGQLRAAHQAKQGPDAARTE